MVFKLQIKTVKILFLSVTQEPMAYLIFNVIFEFLGQFTIQTLLLHFPVDWKFLFIKEQFFLLQWRDFIYHHQKVGIYLTVGDYTNIIIF